MDHIESLSLFMELAKENIKEGKLWISQKEIPPKEVTLADEDSSGISGKISVQLLLEGTEKSLYFFKEFAEQELFADAQNQIKELMDQADHENVSSSEMQEKLRMLRSID